MPSNEEHAQNSYKRYGIRAEDLHRWMDEPHKLYGNAHRWVRHKPNDVKNPPKWAVEKYGLERTKDIMMDHMLLDWETSNYNRYSKSFDTTINIDFTETEDIHRILDIVNKKLDQSIIEFDRSSK